MLHTFVTFEIWGKLSLYNLFLYGKIFSKEKMQEIFFEEEIKCVDLVSFGPKITMFFTSNTIISNPYGEKI
jgi:hypothetical protein